MDSDKLVNLDRTLDLTSFRHLCCIYDNVNDYMEVITNIIKNGLDANERIFYSGDFENTDLVLKHLLSMGINVEGLISKGQLGLNVFELKRICNDFVDTAQIISMLDSEVQKAFSMGFKGLRVIGEMSFAKACNFSTSEIIEHEAKIDDFANKKNKSSVFCLFNKNLFPPSIILDILLTQEAICVGTDVYENFISIPKDILLQNNRDEVLLDFWIRNLKERTKIHESYFLDSIIENIPNMIFIKDAKNLRFLKLNKAGEQLLGYSREEFIGKNDYDFFPKEEADFFTSKDRKVLENKVLMDIEEETIHTKNLGTRHLHTKKIPLLNDEGKPLYLLGVSEDITDKLKAQEALELSERKYKAIVEDQTEFICRLTPENGVITFANDAYCRACGKTKGELIGSSLFDYIPDYEQTRLRNHFKSFTNDQSVKMIEHKVLGVDNTHHIQQWTDRAIFDEKGVIVEFQSVGRDVTELRLVQQKYELKESLIKEIHHRVKNNLQVISSFLDLQTYHVKNNDVVRILKQSQNRISAIALVYDHLCYSEEISDIYMKKYVKELTNSLSVSHNGRNGRIKINHNIDDILLDIDKAMPCGLIINELITNSLKHAFPDETNGDVNVELKKNSTKYTLKVSDNGIGIPHNHNIENSNSLGLQIVASLTRQINGQLDFSRNDGTQFVIVF